MEKSLIILLVIALFSCNKKSENEAKSVITQNVPEIKNGLMTPEALWYFGRIGEFQLSPDKKTIAMTVTFYDIEKNKGNSEIYIIDTESNNPVRLTETPMGESNIVWKPDNMTIAYLYPDQSGAGQIFEMSIDGNTNKQISDIPGGISGFSYSPDGQNVLFTADVPKKPSTEDLHPDMPEADVRILDELMYRHWDTWVASYSHIFIAKYSDKIEEGKDIMKDEKWESPVRPMGGMEQITWSPDSKSIIYTCRKLTGVKYARSTNTDLYKYNIDSGQTINLTEGMAGYDWNPMFSNDGTMMAWESMERDGYEADKHRLFIIDFKSGNKKELLQDFDANVYNINWSDDDKSIFFTTDWFGSQEIFSVRIDENKANRITNGIHNYSEFKIAGDKIYALKQSMSKPNELYRLDIKTGKDEEVSFINKDILAKLKMGKVEKRMIKTTDGLDMLTWVIYPPDFDPNKKYPALLYCQGGPQGMVGQFWSYRWNFQIMAANGYIIVAPNRRGVTGFGMKWLEQISGDYGGQNIKDYLSAIDELKKEPFVDADRLGAVGASYGGYSVFHLAGMHNKRFKAFIAHSGIFNFDAQYLETEELWFPDFDYGGPYWEKNNPKVKKSYAASPHLMADKWNTPILIMHGEKDYRISYTQSMQAFTAAQILGVPSKLVLFPGENHWITKPQNAIVWQREFFGWLDRYVKKS
ncbi:MAG: S9 family peptidase [Deltaproteobacteria bacterium]